MSFPRFPWRFVINLSQTTTCERVDEDAAELKHPNGGGEAAAQPRGWPAAMLTLLSSLMEIFYHPFIVLKFHRALLFSMNPRKEGAC